MLRRRARMREMEEDKTGANKGTMRGKKRKKKESSQLGTEDNKLLIRVIYPGRAGDLCPNSSH